MERRRPIAPRSSVTRLKVRMEDVCGVRECRREPGVLQLLDDIGSQSSTQILFLLFVRLIPGGFCAAWKEISIGGRLSI